MLKRRWLIYMQPLHMVTAARISRPSSHGKSIDIFHLVNDRGFRETEIPQNQ